MPGQGLSGYYSHEQFREQMKKALDSLLQKDHNNKVMMHLHDEVPVTLGLHPVSRNEIEILFLSGSEGRAKVLGKRLIFLGGLQILKNCESGSKKFIPSESRCLLFWR